MSTDVIYNNILLINVLIEILKCTQRKSDISEGNRGSASNSSFGKLRKTVPKVQKRSE